MLEVDVLIIGAGPAGCATALSFFKSKPAATFVVIDDAAADHNLFKIGESLPPEAAQVLSYLSPNLPRFIAEPGHLRCTGNASIWESPEVHELYAIMNPLGSGWHLDRVLFDQMLRDTVSATGKNRYVTGKFTRAEKKDGSWTVYLEDLTSGEEIVYCANWLIDASGRKASVARKLGANMVKSNDMLAFYVLFEASDAESSPDADRRTLIEATPVGWFYSSLLPRQRRIVAFHTSGSSSVSVAKVARRLPGFMDILREHSTIILEIIEDKGYSVDSSGQDRWPKATSAGSAHLEPFGSQVEQWFSVGDAAMEFDPLSSQGIITALKSGCMLGMSLAEKKVDLKPLEMVYKDIWDDYVTKRNWYYQQAAFDGEEFWRKQK